LEGSFLTLDSIRIPVSRSSGQRSGSSGPLMLTHIVRHIFRMARPTNFEWMTTTHIRHRRHDLQGQRSRLQGHVISLSRVGPVAHKSKMNSCSITKICTWYSDRVDYCNGILHRVAALHLRLFQSVLNAAARLIVRKRKFLCITLTLRDKPSMASC